MATVTHLWRLVERWRQEQRFDVSQAALAKEIGVERTAVSQWKYGQTRPTPESLRGLQSATGIRYRDLTDALLQDMGYLSSSRETGDGGRSAASSLPAPVGAEERGDRLGSASDREDMQGLAGEVGGLGAGDGDADQQ